MKSPDFLRKFSKGKFPEERKQVAQEIKAKRAEHFVEKHSNAERYSKLQNATDERRLILTERLNTLSNLESEIAELSTSRLGEIINYFELKKLRVDVAIGQKNYDELRRSQDAEVVEKQTISEKLGSTEIPPVLQEAKTMLGDFYEGQKKKWARSEYTKEDIIKNFSEEHLASLSLEDYALLLKRFPGEMVTHVTRQGIRDHIGHLYHTGGEGAYTNGFMKMVDDGRLRSPLGVYLVEGDKKQAVAKFLQLDSFQTKEEALSYLALLVDEDMQGQGSYADRIAVHFATEEVADCYYGSEKGNEIFIAYPSAYIASQYYFSGQLSESGGGYWNDQWVWANEERGMDLSAGIVFIPEEVRVDKTTGSRYELDKNKNPIVNQELIAFIQKFIESPKFFEFATQAREILGKFNQDWADKTISLENIEARQKLEPFRLQLEREFGMTDRRIQRVILDYNFLPSLYVFTGQENIDRKKEYLDRSEESIKNSLRDRGMFYGEAKNSTSSKEFWENHFAKNPTKRPSKIIYYKDSSPTSALWEWQKSEGIVTKSKDRTMGFPERRIDPGSPQGTAGLDRFKILAQEVIEDYFSKKEPNIAF